MGIIISFFIICSLLLLGAVVFYAICMMFSGVASKLEDWVEKDDKKKD